MTELPPPAFVFTIPSLHDDTDLECRIYHSKSFLTGDNESGSIRGSIVAHPYAPLGGCYDDPIVLCLVGELLERDFVVGTFNFRGAGASNARTSWTARAETQDYTSFLGLIVYYLYSVQPAPATYSSDPEAIDLLLSGYSYGAMITTLTPTGNTCLRGPLILQDFVDPVTGSAAAEIRLRAARLARSYLQSRPTSPSRPYCDHSCGHSSEQDKLAPPSSTITVGGDESLGGRRSTDSSRLRHSIERSRRKLHLGKDTDASSTDIDIPPIDLGPEPKSFPKLRCSYLLISPILGPIAHLSTLSPFTYYSRPGQYDKLVYDKTMVIYGDSDAFTSCRKLRRWCEEWKKRSTSVNTKEANFMSREIKGAGHFWREEGVEEELRRAVGEFLRDERLWVRDGGQGVKV